MDTTTILTTIISVIIVAVIVFFVYMSYKRSAKGKEEANKFLDGLKDVLYKKILLIIKGFDYDKYDNLVGIELDIINELVSACKEYIQEELTKSGNILSALALKALTPEFISKFVDALINLLDLDRMIEAQLGDRYEKFAKQVSEEESDLEKQFANGSLYYIDEENIDSLPETKVKELLESDENGLEKRGFTLPSKEEEAKLNPQVEEDESYNENDESMELIDEENTYVDSRGRLHDKRTGKFIKM